VVRELPVIIQIVGWIAFYPVVGGRAIWQQLGREAKAP
jgi:hypothetical protein